ncbi:septal ring lytic transglycosylase RlpA family protein [Patescibacteria group bacterium]|nr:septal ring lytic transglycosylase RlpA family protein [Patescibacteria group bacterium]
MKQRFLFSLIILIFSLIPAKIFAGEIFEINLDKNTLSQGYTIFYDENEFKLAIPKDALKRKTQFTVSLENSFVSSTPGYTAISDIYKIRNFSKKKNPLKKDLGISLKYHYSGFNNKEIRYYDYQEKKWKKLETEIDLSNNIARANLPKKNVRQIAVFEKTYEKKIHRTSASAFSELKKYHLGKQLNLKLKPGTFSTDLNISLKQIKPGQYPNLPDEDIHSNLFQYKIRNKQKPKKSIILKLQDRKLDEESVCIKRYTKKSGWQDTNTNFNKEKGVAVGKTRHKSGIFGVFEHRDFQTGGASWYNWNGAASNDYPMGTKLKVTNLANNQSTEVTVVSTGPFTSGLIIDLPYDKFAEIADPNTGIIQVRVQEI